jgi:hypothetical protein
LEIPTSPPPVHSALVSTLEPNLIVSMAIVAEMLQTVIDEMTHGPNFKPVNMFHVENVNHTPEDLTTGDDQPNNQKNMHLVSQDTSTFRANQ